MTQLAHRSFRCFSLAVSLLITTALLTPAFGGEAIAKRPNFVFLVSEDNSTHYLRLYGAQHGQTPHIDRLAREGLVFEHAFSCSPVCSVARSTLATGLYAPRGGFQYHRKAKPANLPKEFLPWSAALKEAGYYTTNRRKTDYNFVFPIQRLWHASSNRASWRNRPTQSTPFFHMQSFGQSHESSLHFRRAQMATPTHVKPEDVTLAPYHPDTPTFRYTHARYFDRMSVIDKQVGQVINQLRQDKLLEDTFVFYFGDHGGVLPRSKGYAYDTGLHVPLVIRVPRNFRHLVDHNPGARLAGFVSFVDFGPTVLHLAGVDRDRRLDGRPFLGPDVSASELASRDIAFGHADRFDEKYDHVRTLRKGRFSYIRNYQGYYPDGLHNNYRYRMLAFAEWRELHRQGKLNEIQQQFFQPRPAEQLFDLDEDPHQVHNLAADKAHRTTLLEMRTRLTAFVTAINDLSLYPESHQVAEALSDPIAFGESHHDEIVRLHEIADLALAPRQVASEQLSKHMSSSNPWQRYWACQALAMHPAAARTLKPQIQKATRDSHLLVRLRAAECLVTAGLGDPRPTLYDVLNESRSESAALLALNSLVFIRDHRRLALDATQLRPRITDGQVARRLDYLAGQLKR